MADLLDQLFSEVDRQLEDVREQATAVTTKVGLLFSATAVLAAVAAANFDKVKTGEIIAFITIGGALLLGIPPLVARMISGPTRQMLITWSRDTSAQTTLTALFDSKVGALESNSDRLRVMTGLFYGQVAGTVAALIAATLTAVGR